MKISKATKKEGSGLNHRGVKVSALADGDTAKIKVRGSFEARRPMFRLGKRKYLESKRRVEFVSATTKLSIADGGGEFDVGPRDLNHLLIECARGMVLGEISTFVADAATLNDEGMSRTIKIDGVFASVENDADRIIFKIELIWILRGGKEHMQQGGDPTGPPASASSIGYGAAMAAGATF